MKNNQSYIQIDNLNKFIKKTQVLKNVSFNVEKGSFHGFIGVNGSGKTTTIKAIMGSYNNFEGSILIDGKDNNNESIKKIMGYVPERPVFPKNEKVISYLKYMGTLSGMTLKSAKEKAENLLKEFNLINLKNKDPNKLSSGEKKKIMLLQALINDPKLLILDEPTANLDPIAREEMFGYLIKLNNNGVTIIITSHILFELDTLIKDVTAISNGKILYTGTASNFKGKETLSKAFVKLIKEKGDKNV